MLLALLLEAFGRHTRLPRISLLVLLGFILGPAALGLIDTKAHEGFNFVALLALSMVGFLVGGKLSLRLLHRVAKLVIWLSLWEVVITFSVVAAGLLLFSQPLELALLLAAIATATDPAATLDAIRASRTSNRFSDTLTGIVAIDDAWCLILFSLVMVVLQGVGGSEVNAMYMVKGFGELTGSILLGVLLGLPMALLSGRVRRGEPTLLEALGMVMLCGGIAVWLELSYLLACVSLGATVVNTANTTNGPSTQSKKLNGRFWPYSSFSPAPR
jgi:NhaP-type Na+/H+ or K+/H+ antiporter